ncbi:Synaptotagmin-15 [Holothuria leucospilota]|uniref:Synaptotagmin-15 n=1 Tax=Holothuria leucospilota TaxID=206669 RepID=A0A9Q0YIZ3_HOLLE|nr:Synaptotagmin-15 [Holothuria leucospilota]
MVSSSVVILASVCGAAILAALVFLLYRVYRRRCRGRSKYERLGGIGRGVNFKMPPPPSVQIDGKSLSTPSVSMKAVPFTLPPAPVQRERIGGFTFPPPSSPSKEALDQPLGWNSERRASYTGAPHLATGAGHNERRSSLIDDGGTRRDSVGTVSLGSCDSDGGSPTHGNGSLIPRNESRRPSLVEVPQGAFVLGGLNPELYKIQDEEEESDFPDDHIGRIWFAVEYELESERLVVSLIKARNLPSRTLGVANQCDPLVKVFLLPEERRHLQSKVKRKTANPKFDESFVFQVTFKALQQRTLRLSVFDVDRSKKHRLIGHAMYPLKDLDYETHQKVVMWLDLEKEVNETTSEMGDIHFSLNYNNTVERLTVVVLEAKGLKMLEGFQHVDGYVKVSLMSASKVIKAKKTEVVKKESNPTFNESFQFKVPSDSLDTISICVAVMQHAPGVKGDKQIGRVVVGPFMYARGKELEHWNEMVSRMKESVAQWHSLT